MARGSFIMAILIMTTNVSAQMVPNGDFENWSNGEPQNWVTYNSISALMGLTTMPVVQLSPAPIGNYAIKMTCMYSESAADFIPGFAYLGNMNLLTGQGNIGVPFSETPIVYSGVYQHHVINPGDTAVIACVLSKWDASLSAQIEVASATMLTTTEVSEWTDFSIPFVYNSTETPDTMSVYLYSFGGDGASLSVDQLSFGSSIGIEEQSNEQVRLFPNPANDEVWVDLGFLRGENIDVDVFDMSGQKVCQAQWKNDRVRNLNIHDLSSGYYMIVLRTKEEVFHKTFIKN
jgi:hypothetical protein